ncbi:MAG: glycosyltransferase, partial [Gemmatimonadetes bacterium]|nr:glycosyltransferase [Gemmatimonadota bacterium]NIT85530.1 glycosyltransferase [Gemmatimonadota bacterium]NIU72129.1 glycosyltransferase [Gammaproteobacteria bacterium]NIX37819.1 glycosyltransferase [Gemmatimonadota bacterium]NIY38044.1 glycosyltransferase [Gemmatimonadota bacterium]
MIYVCIPTHNEASTIGVLLWKTRNVLGEFGRDYRLVVHDDASTDETAEVLQRYR